MRGFVFAHRLVALLLPERVLCCLERPFNYVSGHGPPEPAESNAWPETPNPAKLKPVRAVFVSLSGWSHALSVGSYSVPIGR